MILAAELQSAMTSAACSLRAEAEGGALDLSLSTTIDQAR